MNLVTGKSKILTMIGQPIRQVKSPGLLNRYFARQGIDAVVTPVALGDNAVDGFFDLLRRWDNCHGCIVTVPHKQAAYRNADRCSELAQRVRACNLVRRSPRGELTGDMVDGLGYVDALATNAYSLERGQMVLVGGGGVGSAIAHAAAEAGVTSIAVIEIDPTRRSQLVESLRRHYRDLVVYDSEPGPAQPTIVANATPLGMRPDDPWPYPLDGLDHGVMVTDVVTAPACTPWLYAARSQGCRILTGPEMVRAQLKLFLRLLDYDVDAEAVAASIADDERDSAA